ncbi:MAG: ABC transporter ATP-binding protein [Desulfobacterales bacterium]|nr:ABC transporter ATP-binding protein [Desulfobacterales bacterium]
MGLLWDNVSFSVREGFWMRSKTILKSIQLEVPSGKVLGLIGPNGAGKTTTIKLGAGLVEPDTGKVVLNGRNVILPDVRKLLGFLTETQYIYPYLYLEEWLMMLGSLSGLTANRLKKRVDTVLAQVELTEQTRQKMGTLSKGQTQRAGLAQALLHEPEVLLLDEPMSGLDPYWRFQMQNIILDCKQKGMTILFSSHILDDVERLSDSIVLIQGGQVQWQGSLKEMNRKINYYEVVCDTDHVDILKPFAIQGKVEKQPDGSYEFNMSCDQKDAFLHSVISSQIYLQTLKPVHEGLKDILFGSNLQRVLTSS